MDLVEPVWQALQMMLEPGRLLYLCLGVMCGLILGILPGIGGIAGIALLLPFTFGLDPATALAFILGLAATTATGDPIPAILFGVPGGAGSAATVLDGVPMAKRGEAGRALSAAYMSSLLGGVFGAILMGLALPLIRPVILYVGAPELLALSIFGVSMVAVLSGNSPLRGMLAACLGIMIAMIGSDPHGATLRWTMGTLYLYDGLPLVPLILGLYALPELCDLLINRTSVSKSVMSGQTLRGMVQGAKDCFRNWWLVLRCSWIGAGFGMFPGIGGSVIDWLAYSHALSTEKGARSSFGKGDVRGVIASESANNAKEGGALIPTIAFGVPASASMALLLGAFMIHGLTPGPEMLTTHIEITYSMVWSIALANILGAGLCYAFSGQFAKLSTLRYTLILPTVLCIIYVGAFQESRHWGDLFLLLGFGVLGWLMKQLRWPRPPLILGLVLGEIIERYLFISIQRYDYYWLGRPVVVIMLALAVVTLTGPLIASLRKNGGVKAIAARYGAPAIKPRSALAASIAVLFAVMLLAGTNWNVNSKIVPFIVGSLGLAFAVAIVILETLEKQQAAIPPSDRAEDADEPLHMDLDSDTGHLPRSVVIRRASIFFGWLLAFMASMAIIGIIPTIPLFVIAFMRLEGRERWTLALGQAFCLTAFIYAVFDRIMHVPWPPTLLGSWFPMLKFVPSL